MKAPVLFEQRAPLRVGELQVQAPRADEVLVRMVASDLITRRYSIDEADVAFRDLAGALAPGLVVF